MARRGASAGVGLANSGRPELATGRANSKILDGKIESECGDQSCQAKNEPATSLLPTLGAQSWQDRERARGSLLPGIALHHRMHNTS